MSRSQGRVPHPAQGVVPAKVSNVGSDRCSTRLGVRPGAGWGALTLFLLSPQSWPTKEKETGPSLSPSKGPRSWVQKVTEPGATPEDPPCIFRFSSSCTEPQ